MRYSGVNGPLPNLNSGQMDPQALSGIRFAIEAQRRRETTGMTLEEERASREEERRRYIQNAVTDLGLTTYEDPERKAVRNERENVRRITESRSHYNPNNELTVLRNAAVERAMDRDEAEREIIENYLARNQISTVDSLEQQAGKVLVKQLYGQPIEIPEFLVINGLRVSFVSFQDISNMLSQSQIERFTVEPLLQAWVGGLNSPNRIMTFFNKNGMTYLAKVQYDQINNQILPFI